MRKTANIILPAISFLLFFSSLVSSQTDSSLTFLKDVQLQGNHLFTKNEIIQLSGFLLDKPFRLAEIRPKARQLLEAYRLQGYYQCSIDSIIAIIDSVQRQTQLQIFINEGAAFQVGELKFNGLSEKDKQKWLNQFETGPGEILDELRLAEDIEQGLRFAENNGFPLCEIRFDSVQLTDINKNRQNLKLILRVDPGQAIKISEVSIRGNQLTRDQVIRRETRIKSGEIYRHAKIAKIPRQLLRLGFLEAVQPPQLYMKHDGKAGLLITVKEGNANQFDGVVGYTPGTTTQKGYFTGLLNISLGNLLGTGRKVMANWQKKNRQSQTLSFQYQEPWTFGFPVHSAVQFQQAFQDTTYIQRDWDLEFQVPLTDNFLAVLKIGKQAVLPDSLGAALFNIPKSTTNNLTLGLNYDTRNELLNPRNGLRYSTSLEFGRKKTTTTPGFENADLTDDTYDQKKIRFDFEFYQPVFNNQVLSTHLHARQITSGEKIIHIPEQFRLGGAQTLRGYREDQFRGTRVAWANLEYRYLLSRRSRAFLFCDIGYFSRIEAENKLVEGYKPGYGFGIRLETRLGIMGIDYGLGEGSGLLAGLLHVGLVNEF